MARVRIKFTIVREVGAAKSMRLKHYSCHVDWRAGFAVIARCAGGGWGYAGGFNYDLVITARVVDRDQGGLSAAPGHGSLQPFVLLACQVGFFVSRISPGPRVTHSVA